MMPCCAPTDRLRVFAWIAVALLVLAASPSEARRARSGAIVGQIKGVTPAEMGEARFYLDGVSARARLSLRGFRIGGVRRGDHSLSVVSPDGYSGAHASVRVRAGRSVSVGVLALDTGGQIAGLVSARVGEEGRLEPLPGVQVVAEMQVPKVQGAVRGSPHDPPGLRLVAITDEDGSYLFRALPPGFWQVSVVVPGYALGVEYVSVEPRRTAVADFILEPEIAPGVGTVEGFVTTPDGTPIEGALVTVFSHRRFAPRTVSRYHKKPGPFGPPPAGVTPPDQFATLTDQEGFYHLNVPSGRLLVTASASGFEPKERDLILHPRQTARLDFQLRPAPELLPGAIAGRVTDAVSGEPVAGAVVLLLYQLERTRKSHPVADEFSAITDHEGEFAIDGVPEGTWVLVVQREGYVPNEAQVTIRRHETTHVHVSLHPAETHVR